MLYTAISIYRTSSESPSYQPLYSEEVTAVEADSEEMAKVRAIAQGKEAETSYQNDAGETITVHFDAVIDVQEPVDAEALSGEGTLYVRHFRDYDAYKSFEPLLEGQAL